MFDASDVTEVDLLNDKGAGNNKRQTQRMKQTCQMCNSPNMQLAGTCFFCHDCGSSTGCS